jgi:O-antigen/teichoic acid export membrane protein
MPPADAPPPRHALGAAARNLAWLGLDKAVAVVLGLLVFGLVARTLGPQGAGQFSYAVAVLQTALGLSLVCSSAAVLPRLCRLPDGAACAATANVFVVRLAGSLLAAGLAAAYVLVAISDPQRRAVTLMMLAAVPLIEPFHAFGAYWQSRNHNRPLFVARAGGLLARLALVLAALWLGAAAWVIALAWVLEAAVAAALQVQGIGRVRPWPALRRAVRTARSRAYLRHGARFMAGLLLSHLFLRMDRLWLAERMNPHDFGLYATAMQLVEVWLQVALLLSGSIAPAFLYQALRRSTALRSHVRVIAGFAALGGAGLLGAWLLGPWLLATVFGAPFAASQPYLVAGFGAAVLFFVDQFVQVAITAGNRPLLLALKWTAACAAAAAVLVLGTPHWGAFAGPAGLAGGIVAGWLAVALARQVTAPRGRPTGRAPALLRPSPCHPAPGATHNARTWPSPADPVDPALPVHRGALQATPALAGAGPSRGEEPSAADGSSSALSPSTGGGAAASEGSIQEAPMLVSIVINNFNYGRYIRAAIDSALAQTWRPLEVVVVDDGSTDDSWHTIRSYGDRVLALRQPNGGQGAAYNAGFAASCGQWVLFLDADDLLDPQAVERCLGAARSSTAKVQFMLRTIGPDGAPLGGMVPYLTHQGNVAPIVRRYALYAGPPASGNLYRRSAIERYLPMPTLPWQRGADTVPFVLSALHGKVVTVPEALGSYRLHTPGNARSGVLGNMSRSMREALFQPHRSRVALLAWAAQRTTFRFHDHMLALPGDWRLRALSWRLEPGNHPFRQDTRGSIWRGARQSLRHWPGYTPMERLLQLGWLAFVLAAPHSWVRHVARSNVSGGLRARLRVLRGAGAA